MNITPTLFVGRGKAAITATLLLLSAMPAAPATLVLEHGRERVTFETGELLTRPDAADLEILADNAYRGPQRYRAVPLSALLAALPPPQGGVVETGALDGFAAQIPLSLAVQAEPSGPQAWVAIEPSDAPWPKLPGKASSAGPFYIVWAGPGTWRLSSEYWAYQVVALRYVPSPAARWPQMTVDPSLPPDHPARAGQEVFAGICLACHRMNGAGSSVIGPDLNVPMNPTEYFQLAALRRYLRKPDSVRTWPGQKMPAFGPEKLSDTQLEALLVYLSHMAERRSP
jgi:mono/diheme cytochrome c family protein